LASIARLSVREEGADMTKLTVSLAGVDYDRTRALFDGTVQIEGCETIAVAMSPEQAFHRAFRFQEFDITELSLSSYMNVLDRGMSHYVAIPVFPSRLFRHSSIYIRTDRGITGPRDLAGRLVGVPEYQMTAAVWVRGILQDRYGVRPADMRWRTGGLEEPGRVEKSRLSLPDIDLAPIPSTETLSRHLESGQIDALISALAPSCFGRDPKIGRLFPDYRAAEEAYYKDTGIFPIMHVVGIRRRLIEAHPWLAVNTFMAYVRAKEICMRDMEKIGHLFTTLPWPVEELQRARALMGHDFWSYGADTNMRELEAVTRYAHEQGLTSRRIPLDELFVPSTLSLAKV
jgi:4,5-dihydroxyphthalate decarboxylase